MIYVRLHVALHVMLHVMLHVILHVMLHVMLGATPRAEPIGLQACFLLRASMDSLMINHTEFRLACNLKP